VVIGALMPVFRRHEAVAGEVDDAPV
jgi:hypothetical protein